MCLIAGCGTTKHHTATEQLLMSDAVDATISKLDFSPLAHRKVFLDTAFINKPSFAGQSLIIDSNYILSALRQQMVSVGVLLVDNREDADLIAEPRIGALGIDGHDVIYGVPASNALSNASAVVPGTPLLPPLPEISVARREAKLGAAKVAVFAYHRETRQPYWQSGIAQSNSDSKSTWVLGIGPFQRGSIHDGTRFAGDEVLPLSLTEAEAEAEAEQQEMERFASSQTFFTESDAQQSETSNKDSSIVTAGHQEARTPVGDQPNDQPVEN
jgi:hypothetical protein